MKTAILSFFTLLFAAIFVSHLLAQTPAQYNISGDAKVGLIVTGTGNTINTTQIFGKSPEYSELKKVMDKYEADIAQKAATCEKMAKDNLPAEYRDGCRSELVALNAVRDSVAKVEKRFREDVIRLAETFSTLKINSERLRLAKQFFEEGKIREADMVLKASEMKTEGDALLAEKARQQEKLHRTDSLLRIKADEFALKARLKATDYADALRYDSAKIYFDQSLLYAESAAEIIDFTAILSADNQTALAVEYAERAMKLPLPEMEAARFGTILGNYYMAARRMPEAEKIHLASVETLDRLAKTAPAQAEPDLGESVGALALYYATVQRMPEAEKAYLRSMEVFERLAKADSARFEPRVGAVAVNLGSLYANLQRMGEAEKLLSRAYEIYDRAAKANPAEYERPLATTALNLGTLYKIVQKLPEAEKAQLRALEIYEKLAKDNPIRFELGVIGAANALGDLYPKMGRSADAEKQLLRALEIGERRARINPASFESGLSNTASSLANLYNAMKRNDDAERMYLMAIGLDERLAAASPAQFEQYLAMTALDLGSFYGSVNKLPEAEKTVLRSSAIFERLAKTSPGQLNLWLARSIYVHGELLLSKGDGRASKAQYERAMSILQEGVLGGQRHILGELGHLHMKTQQVRDSLTAHREFGEAIALQRSRAEGFAALGGIDSSFIGQAVRGLDTLARLCILGGKFAEAAGAAQKVDAKFNAARRNHGHAQLLGGDLKGAEATYTEYFSKEKGPAAAKAALAIEWDGLEAAGVTCPGIKEARAWLKK